MNAQNVTVSTLTRAFRWSSPAANLDGSIPKPWRCADADGMRGVLADLGYDNDRAYVEHASEIRTRKALWVGLRDNRNKVEHTSQIAILANALRALGFRIKFATDGDRPCAIYVIDNVKA